MKIFKKICSSILLIICALLLIVAGWLCIDKFVLKSTVPSFLGYSTLTVSTGSMEPTLKVGDIIVINKTNDYQIGDVITFLPEGDTIPTTHRIIQYGEVEGTYITKGDNPSNSVDTDPVSNEQIFGEMVLHLELLGLFVGWVKNGGGLIYVVAVILILGIGAYMLNNEKKMALLREQSAAAAAPVEEKPAEEKPAEAAPTTNEEPKTEDNTEEQGKE